MRKFGEEAEIKQLNLSMMPYKIRGRHFCLPLLHHKFVKTGSWIEMALKDNVLALANHNFCSREHLQTTFDFKLQNNG